MDSALSDINSIPIDTAIKQTYGRFQVFTTIVYSIGFCMGGFITFALPLLELYPQFECFNDLTQAYEKCSRETACANSKWRVDWNSDISINNWITELDLYCVDKWQIGLFGSLYYLGYFFGSISFVNLSDIIGRKYCTRAAFIGHTTLFVLLVFIPELYSRYVIIFFLGFIGSLRCSVCFNSGCEFLQKHHQIYSSATTQMADACIPLCLSVYFWRITKYWIYFYYVSLVICGVNCILCFLIPESPRWLVSKQRSNEAKSILNKIAIINSKEQIQPDKTIVDDKVYIRTNNTKVVIDNTGDSPLKILWSNHIHRYNLLLITAFWLCSSIMNYIMNFYVKYIKTENIFILIILSAIAELLSKSLNGVILKYLSFKFGTLLFILMAIASSACYLAFHSFIAIVPIIIFFCKFFAGATYASMYFSIPTLFQSKISVTAYNICNISAKVGAVFAPMIAELPGTIPMLCFIACAIISIFLISLLRVPVHEKDIALKDLSDEKNEDMEMDFYQNPKVCTGIQ